MIFRCILPDWAKLEDPSKPKILEGEFTQSQLEEINAKFYNIYYLPNHPSIYEKGSTVDGSNVDVFEYVFVDMDLKDGKYTKDSFLQAIHSFDLTPTRIVDSGNGIHVYWSVSDLDAMTFLKLQRRLIVRFDTDEAVGQIYQLMRYPNTINTKDPENFKICETLFESQTTFTSEEISKALPSLTQEDDEYCKRHYNKTYNKGEVEKVSDKLPVKFGQLLKENGEVKDIWAGRVEDRSIGDFRLGHIMYANGFKRDEAMSVLVNSAKALSRVPVHRVSYASNIVDKIWTFEDTQDKSTLKLSSTVRQILEKKGEGIKGTRFPCYSYLDNTQHGFRLGQVIGLVAGSGVGKTAVALNMFKGFVQNNPDYEHFLIPLEQPGEELADRWRLLCGEQIYLHDKVHILSNYNEDGSFRHLSLDDIREYLVKFQKETGKKIGCVVIDHVGALKKKTKDGENQGLMDICHAMKAFAIETNTLLVMQSQAPRQKAGIGDLELDKDAAYGTIYFESYCDYLITLWQPLKRCYAEEGCPTVTAYKFCKIRHKNQTKDIIKEDVRYHLFFEPETQTLREMTQDEEKSFAFFNKKAINNRNKDKNTDEVPYQSVRWGKEVTYGKTDNN